AGDVHPRLVAAARAVVQERVRERQRPGLQHAERAGVAGRLRRSSARVSPVDADGIEIRPCRPEDVEAVLSLWVRAGAIPRPTDHAAGLVRRLERDRELFALAWDGQRLVGTLMGGWDGWRGNMYRLVVDPGYRRRGIASRLIAAVEA